MPTTGTAVLGWAGWGDGAYARAALERYMQSPAEARWAVVGAWNHGGGEDVDPFASVGAPPQPSRLAQELAQVRFFDHFLQDLGPQPAPGLRYFRMGERVWRETEVWPPAETTPRTWALAEGMLVAPQEARAPHAAARNASRATTQDAGGEGWTLFTPSLDVGSGEDSRWRTQLGRGDVIYKDYTFEPGRFTACGDVLEAPLIVEGSPVFTVRVTPDRQDFALYAALQAVSPAQATEGDARGHVIAEGHLRGRFAEDAGPVRAVMDEHSFTEQAERLIIPNASYTMRITLLPTAVRVPAGYKLCLTLSGADADQFRRTPADGGVSLLIHHEDEPDATADPLPDASLGDEARQALENLRAGLLRGSNTEFPTRLTVPVRPSATH